MIRFSVPTGPAALAGLSRKTTVRDRTAGGKVSLTGPAGVVGKLVALKLAAEVKE